MKEKIMQQCNDHAKVTSFHKGNKPINWLPCINSNGSSVGTFAILGHAETANYRLGDNWGLKFKNNQVHEG